MKPNALAPNRDSNSPHGFCAAAAPPVEVFYIVQSTGVLGERDHHLRSDLYETRPQADVELAGLRHADSCGTYSVWKSVTYIEPAEWLHRVVRCDSSLILPRLRGVEKLTDC